MRLNSFLAMAIVLPLLGGCIEPGYLVTTAAGSSSTVESVDSLRADERPYTHHAAIVAVSPEVVRLRIDDGFSLYDRAKILRAINEWNFVLNGHMRFEVVAPDADGKPRPIKSAWALVPLKKSPMNLRGGSNHEALAVTLGIPAGGGIMLVMLDRIGTRDLAGVMRHELGHVLGLGHDAHGGVMAAVYSPYDQGCIDRRAVQAIAAGRHLPVDGLNWC
jgi:hypothetical protein